MSLLDGYDEIAIQQSISEFRKEFAGVLSTIMRKIDNMEIELNELRNQMHDKMDRKTDRGEFNDRYFELSSEILAVDNKISDLKRDLKM